MSGPQDDVPPGLVAGQLPGFAVGEGCGHGGPAAGVLVSHAPDVAFQIAGGEQGEDRVLGWRACPPAELAGGLGQAGDQRGRGGEPAGPADSPWRYWLSSRSVRPPRPGPRRVRTCPS
jgi:hypothetical protein